MNILDMGESFSINTGTEFYEARSIILATGHGKASYLEGEREYLGRGVGYCATCDGPLYRNKSVTIVSENQEGEEEANFMAEICASVNYLPLYKMDKYELNEKVKLVKGKVKNINGDGSKVVSLITESGELKTDAVFIIRNVIPISQLLEGLTLEEGSIKVDKNMATDIKGVFACGDCVGKPYQIAKSVGEGIVAALSVCKYLDAAL
jgi:thioredoxin reductase (NADPH)